MPPEAPKAKLSSMTRVLVNKATADPTKIEAEFRVQVGERRRKHDLGTQARTKKKKERRDKAVKKLKRNEKKG